MLLKAKWIWKQQDDLCYNQTIVARKKIEAKVVKKAFVKITADSYYRLYINDHWINDGPPRSWPEHFQYDTIEVTEFLKAGINEIKIISRYYGVGDFHRVCKQAGILFQMDTADVDGNRTTVISDETWDIADAGAWVSNTPKISIQMEPFEYYDARLEDSLKFTKATVLYDAYGGPWKDLKPRDVALLSKKPVAFQSFIGANIVRSDSISYCLPATRLVFPGLIEANLKVCPACGMATILKVDKESCFNLYTEGLVFAIDGQYNPKGDYKLNAGDHLILAFAEANYSHIKEKIFRFVDPPKFELQNPVDRNEENPWCFIRFNNYAFSADDIIWVDFLKDDKEIFQGFKKYKNLIESLLNDVNDEKTFNKYLKGYAVSLTTENMFAHDTSWRFKERRVVSDVDDNVMNPDALLNDGTDCTIINPSAAGDIELMYDLGEQNCGYYSFDLTADEGVQMSIDGIEYINPDGRLQHTSDNSNGLCYITRNGDNSYISLKRRSGRYIFITLRKQKSPVHIRNIKLIASTYPIESRGNFFCSDPMLNKIWEISARTLKLGMEDTFTDCSLYEQTLWVGDARNESLFAYGIFGATDITKRSILLAAQSLDSYPMVGCQVPSSWKCIIPVWSFLWGISVWDYYWYTGDKKFLKEIWPFVIRNLKGAEEYINQDGLFSAPFWNLFDWAPIDQRQKTVLHNSMFFVGAINAAIRCSEIVSNYDDKIWLKNMKNTLCRGINKLWDSNRKTYPDSMHDDGISSDSVSQHTSFLSVLYDIIEGSNRGDAVSNMISPPAGMVRVGSPFAIMYLYEAMEKVGLEQKIIESIRENYLPMIEAGATTVWETFAGMRPMSDGPSRSHCHGWSASPLYFFSRVILGVRYAAAGGKAIKLKPSVIEGLTWAKGTVLTPNGPVEVDWQLEKNIFKFNCALPKGTNVEFVESESLNRVKVVKNIKGIKL
ncbi:MAG: hypothetical protein A2Y12_05685 [Planctomycetes bacterium GWF2_42_9]|nr:MAG: hypothetical protein A2Y12_05685 [Planctomycetes bacterium GWF2_42_9]